MRHEITPYYDPITELPYCCVPAVLQMILKRRNIQYESQEDIGYQLGLIVPPNFEHQFSKVRTGPEPKAGYGTQTSKEEFSIPNYFMKHNLPLKFTKLKPTNANELRELLVSFLSDADDLIICYNSQLLFGDGAIEHVSLIQYFDTETNDILLVDPAIGTPKYRKVSLDKLFEVLIAHKVSDHGGLWVVSSNVADDIENNKPT